MTTFVPLPSWKTLAYALINNACSSSSMDPWQERGGKIYKFSGSTWTIGALVAKKMAKKNNRLVTIWFPDYFCNQSTFAARSLGAHIKFYPIGDDLSPDWSACNQMLQDSACDLFIITHFFGADCWHEEAVEFCGKAAATLVEDAAHVLLPHGRIGTFGSYTLFSPHKLLPIPHVGLLLEHEDTIQGDMTKFAEHFDLKSPSSIGWTFTRIAQKLMPEALHRLRNRSLPDFSWSPAYRHLVSTPAPSMIGQRMLAIECANLEGASANRKKNARHWRRTLGKIPEYRCRPFFQVHQEGPSPYRFVLRYKNRSDAVEDYDRLREFGCPVETWPDLASQVISRKEFYANANRFRETLIFLPVHNGLNEESIDKFAHAISSYYS